MAERTRVFIAYCFPEKRWLDRVQGAIEQVVEKEKIVIWDERRLRAGSAWRTELPELLASTKVGVMIVSDLFLQSDFVTRARLPNLLRRERPGGLELCWVLASQCLFDVAGLSEADAGNQINSALDGLSGAQRDAELAEIRSKVALLYTGAPALETPVLPERPPAPAAPAPLPPPPAAASPSPALAAISTTPAPPQVPPNPPAPRESRRMSKKRRRAAAARAEATQPLFDTSLLDETPPPPPAIAEPSAASPLEAPPPDPAPQAAPEPIPETLAPEPAAPAEAASAEPAPESTPAEIVAAPKPTPRRSPLAPLLLALDAAMRTRQETIRKLRRLAGWLLFVAAGAALLSIALAVVASTTHFFLLAGFAAFAASLALLLRVRIDLLGQGLVGLRYARSGLADEALPSRQRAPLLQRAEETLGPI